MRHLLLAAALPLLAACSSTQRVYDVTEVDQAPSLRGDSLVVEAERASVTYVRPARVTRDVAPERSYDLLHTSLDITPRFEDESVAGTVRHRLAPLLGGLERVAFDAVGMDILEAAQIVEGRRRGVGIEADSARLVLVPAEPLEADSTYEFEIRYLAHPARGAGEGGLGEGGRGFYFIDPTGTDPARPTQIWTQGQSSSNRRWFPTWDYPNDRMSFEIALTVPDSLRTFANGELLGQAPAGEGLRRDRWALAHSQPAYLAAVAAGSWAVVEDSVQSIDGRLIPLAYAVDPAFEDEAQAIFGETPRMIEVFEARLGIPYPWPTYRQVAVRDFTAGGMENTTLTLLWEGIQTDERARLDYTGLDLLSHELAHHWFGNYVTAEDWAQLALNEAFASYFEAVYLEATRGHEAAQAHAIAEREAYLRAAERKRRPTVWFGYKNEAEMFDAHTYQKGGLVLRQLRFELGEEGFWKGLNRYLRTYPYATVGMENLRQAMEAATGRGLRGFFEQWWRQPGHPVLEVEQAYFAGSRLYTVQVVQRQNLEEAPVFHFDVNVELNYPNHPRELRRVRIASADTTLRFRVPERPSFVRFNEGDWLLADLRLRQPVEEALVQAAEDDEMAGRYAAVGVLAEAERSRSAREALLRAAAEDAHALVRERATKALGAYAGIPEVAAALEARAREDEAPAVRRAALRALFGAEVPEAPPAALAEALEDASYLTIAEAVRLFAEHYPARAWAAYQPVLALRSWQGVVERALALAIARHRLGGLEGARTLARLAEPMNTDAVRTAAAEGLLTLARRDDEIRRFAAFAFLDLVADARPALRRLAASALGEIGDEAAADALAAQLAEERDPEAKAAQAAALAKLRPGEPEIRR